MNNKSGDCEAYRDILFDYLCDIEDGDAERTTEYKGRWDELEAHLSSCADCRSELSACRGLIAATSDAAYSVPSALKGRISAAVRLERKRARRNKIIGYTGSIAAAFLIFTGIGVAMLSGGMTDANMPGEAYKGDYSAPDKYLYSGDKNADTAAIPDNNAEYEAPEDMEGMEDIENIYDTPDGFDYSRNDNMTPEASAPNEIKDGITDAVTEPTDEESQKSDGGSAETAADETTGDTVSDAVRLFDIYCADEYKSGYVYIMHGSGAVASTIMNELAELLGTQSVTVTDEGDCEYYFIIDYSADDATAIDSFAAQRGIALTPATSSAWLPS